MHYVSEALEELIAAEAYLGTCIVQAERHQLVNRRLPESSYESELSLWKDDYKMLSRAQPFYWSSKCVDLVLSQQDAFDLKEITSQRNLVTADFGFFYFAEKSPFTIFTNEGNVRPVRAMSWGWAKERTTQQCILRVTSWLRYESMPALVPYMWTTNAENTILDVDDRDLISERDMQDSARKERLSQIRFITAAGTFLRQKLLVTEERPLERHARKRLERQGALRVPSVTTVHMRARESRPHEPGESVPVDWHWQWSVKGHVRQQWYSSVQQHLPVLILPYMKGPEDKPIKPRTTPIIAVTR